MRDPTWGWTYWPVFLILVSLAFLGPELYALFTNTGNTLSDYAWRELGIRQSGRPFVHTAAWALTQGMFVVLALWLWRHIWYGDYR